MLSRRNQARNVGHIHHQASAHLVRYLAEALEINGSGVCAGARHDQLGFGLQGDALQLVVVDVSLVVHAVGYDIKVQAGKVHRASVGQMAAMI